VLILSRNECFEKAHTSKEAFSAMNINKVWAEILADRWPAPLHPLRCSMFLSLDLSAIKVSLPEPHVSISCSIICMRQTIAQLLKIVVLHCRWVLLCGSQPVSHSSDDSPKIPGAVNMDPVLCQMVKHCCGRACFFYISLVGMR